MCRIFRYGKERKQKMKQKVYTLSFLIETVVGFLMFIVAQAEISSNGGYTWSPPYTSHEASVITMKWIGILVLLTGLVGIGLMLFRNYYLNRHVTDTKPISQSGSKVRCPECGLMVLSGVKKCPRCGKEM